VAFADCVTNVENETLRPFTRYPDLLDLKQAKRKELGEEIDAGRLTKAQANAQLTEILTHIDNIEAQRSAVAASVAAQQAAALGASSYAPPAHTFKDYMPDAQSYQLPKYQPYEAPQSPPMNPCDIMSCPRPQEPLAPPYAPGTPPYTPGAPPAYAAPEPAPGFVPGLGSGLSLGE
jgi:hypothetical protein